nr:RNA 2',3'-cyclic phosphodiesterase [Lysinibacillus timonensis]
MTEKHHYFFAVKLPNEVKTFLSQWVQMHKETYPFARWVHPEDYHITLAFLGFAKEAQLNKAIDSMGPLLSEDVSFPLTLDQIGTFGAPKSPRIFWAGVKESDELKQIQKKVFNMCLETGFELDKKPFKPHITMARKWKSDQPFEKGNVTVLKTSEGDDFIFNVNEIVLYETHLDKTPKYNEFARFPIVATN